MINKKDIQVGKIFWYSKYYLQSSFQLKGSRDRVVVETFNNCLYLKIIETGNLIFLDLSRILRHLYYTEEEAIDSLNNVIEEGRVRLNKLLDYKLCFEEKEYGKFKKFKDYLLGDSSNPFNGNHIDKLLINNIEEIKIGDILFQIDYKYVMYDPIRSRTPYFMSYFLKVDEITENFLMFSAYLFDFSKSVEENIKSCDKSRYSSNKVFLKDEIKDKTCGIFLGVNELILNHIENSRKNYIESINLSYDKLDEYLKSLKE